MGSGSGVTIVNVQCPLCARAFPKDKVELHASTCEGRSSSPLPEVVDIVDSTAQGSPASQGVSQQNKRMRNVDTVMCPICNEAYPTYLNEILAEPVKMHLIIVKYVEKNIDSLVLKNN